MPTNNHPTDVSSVLSNARSALRLTMQEFAADLGVTRQAVDLWENGTASPTYERIIEWLNDARPWVHQLGAAIANVKYAELLAHTTVTVAAQPTTEGN